MHFALFLNIFLEDIWFLGGRTYILGFRLIFWLHGFIFWVCGPTFLVFGLIFWVYGLIFGVWTCILGVWTYTLGVRVGSGRDGRVGSGRVGRAAGSGEFSIWGKPILGICIRKRITIGYIIEFWTWGIFTKKDTRREMLHWGVPHTLRSLIWDRFRPKN